MSIIHSLPVRAEQAEGVAAFMDRGSGQAVIRVIAQSGLILVEFPLVFPAYHSDGAGTITLRETPIRAKALADGTAAFFQAFNRDGQFAYQGNVVQQGLAGDLQVLSLNVRENQDCALIAHSYEAPD